MNPPLGKENKTLTGLAEENHFCFYQRFEVKDLTSPVILGTQQGFKNGMNTISALHDLPNVWAKMTSMNGGKTLHTKFYIKYNKAQKYMA